MSTLGLSRDIILRVSIYTSLSAGRVLSLDSYYLLQINSSSEYWN